MAVSSKIPLPPVRLASPAPKGLDRTIAGLMRPELLNLKCVAEPAKLDFAPSPRQYRANGGQGIKKPKARLGPRVDLSPRLELSLNVQCDVAKDQDPALE